MYGNFGDLRHLHKYKGFEERNYSGTWLKLTLNTLNILALEEVKLLNVLKLNVLKQHFVYHNAQYVSFL
jgi:hypothetical protein